MASAGYGGWVKYMAERLEVKPLSREDFAPFGDVIEFAGSDFYPINGGMADRYHALAKVDTGGNEAGAVISLHALSIPKHGD